MTQTGQSDLFSHQRPGWEQADGHISGGCFHKYTQENLIMAMCVVDQTGDRHIFIRALCSPDIHHHVVLGGGG